MLDWSKPDHVAEAYNFLSELTKPLPLALQILCGQCYVSLVMPKTFIA